MPLSYRHNRIVPKSAAARALVAVSFSVCVSAVSPPASAQGVREFTRSAAGSNAQVSESQAADVTLTLTDAAFRPVQTWVRTAGEPDASGKVLKALIAAAQADLVRSGQRLRAFSVRSRSQMQQGIVSKVTRGAAGVTIEATLSSAVPIDVSHYVMEIVTEKGPFLTVPNVSIIEEDGLRFVYLDTGAGAYSRREIKTGIQGELYTQITEGLSDGDQVVSVGSFFVDAEAKLKATGMPSMPGMDHSGMDHRAMGHSMSGMSQNAPSVSPAPQTLPPGGLKLTMTDPADSGSESKPVAMIHLMFNAAVDPTKARISVANASGQAVDVGAPMLMGQDGKMLMVVPASTLPKGSYAVTWSVTGSDGKAVEGTFRFTAN